MPFKSPPALDHLTRILSSDNARVAKFIDSLEGREQGLAPPPNERPAGERADAGRDGRAEGEK